MLSVLTLEPTKETIEKNKDLFNLPINQRIIKKNAAISTLMPNN